MEIGVDINFTAIERNLRLYGMPGALILIGVVGMLLIDPAPDQASPVTAAIAPLARMAFIGSVLVALVGLIWMGWRVWLEWRWMSGKSDGGCLNCGGDMRHLEGRYSRYSKCLMCGAKRKGHH